MVKKYTVTKAGNQIVNIHIHEKSKQKVRRQKRKKVSSSGSIRTLNRLIPVSSEFPQQRTLAQTQTIVLPDGDKALGQSNPLSALTYQKQLVRLAIKEYEDEVKGKSTVERENPIMSGTPIPLPTSSDNDMPFTPVKETKPIIGLTKPFIRRTKPIIRRIKPLAQINIVSVIRGRRDEAIEEYKINTTGLTPTQVNKLITEAHKSTVINL